MPSTIESIIPRWYYAISHNLPEEGFQEGIILNEGFPEDYEPILTDLDFMILCRTIDEEEHVSKEIVSRELRNLGFEQLKEISELSLDRKYITRREKKLIKRMIRGELNLREFFIGIRKDSREAQQHAHEIVLSAIIRKPWQLWK